MPFLITESRKIIWPFHASREIQNKISRSRKSQNSNKFIPRITNHGQIKFSITRHEKTLEGPFRGVCIVLKKLLFN